MVDNKTVKMLNNFIRSNKYFVKFWEELDVSIEDVIQSLSINTNTTIGKIFKMIRKEPELYDNFPKNLNIEAAFLLSPRKRNEKLKEIFEQHIELILGAYFCTMFGNSFQSPSIWAKNNILTDKEKAITKDNFPARTFLTYNHEKKVLTDVYYDLIMIKKEQERYKINTTPTFSGKLSLSQSVFERIFNDYEKQRRNHRNRIKVWWYKDSGKDYNIVFRRSLSKSISIHLVNKNKFQIAADTKTLTIRKDLSEMGLCTKKNKGLILKFLKWLLEKQSGINVEFELSPFLLKKADGDRLLDNLLHNTGNKIKVVEITVINFPVKTNPEVKILAVGAEGIEEAIVDFGKKSMGIDKKYIKNMRVKYKDKYLMLKPTTKGGEIEVSGKGINNQFKSEFLSDISK